jgi:lipopolysaccharide heptosyltransferase I
MKILVIKPSSLGDVIHALRVIAQLKAVSPTIEIDWVIKSGFEEVLRCTDLIDKVYKFERGSGFRSYLSLIKQIRTERYDYAIDLQGLLRSAVLCLLSRSSQKIGVADGREGSTLFYRKIGVSSRRKEIHAIDRLTPFLKEVGVGSLAPSLPLLFPSSKLEGKTDRILKDNPYILLFPESRRREKVWPHFAKLSKLLTADFSHRIVIAGNNRDEFHPGAIDLRNRINLTELPALIDRASVVVTNDSAPLHIASALKKPLVAIFGPTSAKRYGPYPQNSEQNIILTAQEKNLETISVEQVANAIEQSLGS